MKVLIISQVYWPDTASVAQHLSDLGEEIAKDDSNKVDVISSRNNYENPQIKYVLNEKNKKVAIKRLNNTGFGKKYKIGRLLDFITFNLLLTTKLLFIKSNDYDLILGLTSPPLVSFIGSFVSKLKKIKFCYWVMDLQPELSISAGYLKKNSIIAKFLVFIGDYVFTNSDLIIVLDIFMKNYIESRIGANTDKLYVIPVWPIVESEYCGERISNPFRVKHGFGDKIVIMYSGNHSVVHPLDTLLAAAKKLADDDKFLFVFIGEGIRKKDVTIYKEKYNLKNIIQLPYQKRSEVHLSLSSADIQVVILGDNQVGFTHPNKIYGSMYVGKPIMYIGPAKSHITQILNDLDGNISVSHGQTDLLVSSLKCFSQLNSDKIKEIEIRNKTYAQDYFSSELLKVKIISLLSNITGKNS